MLTIPFGHTIDAVAAVLGEPAVLGASLATRRARVADAESGHTLPMNAADQIAVTARGADKELAALEVPASYHRLEGLGLDRTAHAYNVAHAYAQILGDLEAGTQTVPDFDHAVRRHETLQAVLEHAGQPWEANGA